MPDYFTLPELRALPDVSNATRYPDPRCEAAAAYIVAVIEREVGTSFVSRTVTGEVHHGGTYVVALKRPHARTLTTVTLRGVDITAECVLQDGTLWRYGAGSTEPSYFDRAPGALLVTYAAGYSATPPGDIKEAALQGTRARLLATNGNALVEDRRTNVTSEQGSITYAMAGKHAPTGYPEVDAVIHGWRSRLDVLGFA